jgi:hypothetical protein
VWLDLFLAFVAGLTFLAFGLEPLWLVSHWYEIYYPDH